jgi:hypothetical protein
MSETQNNNTTERNMDIFKAALDGTIPKRTIIKVSKVRFDHLTEGPSHASCVLLDCGHVQHTYNGSVAAGQCESCWDCVEREGL